MKKEVKNILIIGIFINLILAIIKLVGGYLGHTSSLVSDGFNSLSDVLISLLLLITVIVANKKADKDHPYGHEKFEGIINLLLGVFLFLTASIIIYQGITSLISYNKNDVYNKPKLFTIYIAIISIILKVFIYSLNINGYKKYDQLSLKSDAYNHLGDIFATLSSLIGIILSIKGLSYFDNIASIIIGLFIAYNAITVFRETISNLVDESPSKEYNKQIKQAILNKNGVISIDDFKARKHMNKVYVDVEIGVSDKLSLVDAHLIAETVHIEIEKEFEEVIHCMVHVNPHPVKKSLEKK